MASAFERLASLAPWGKPTPVQQVPKSPAEIKMGTVPLVVDTGAWYEEHAQLCFDLQIAAVRAASDPKAEAEVQRAHAALLAHAAIINGGAEPVLLAKDGIHTIPYESLATARAKVSSLRMELARTQAELAKAQAGKAGPA